MLARCRVRATSDIKRQGREPGVHPGHGSPRLRWRTTCFPPPSKRGSREGCEVGCLRGQIASRSFPTFTGTAGLSTRLWPSLTGKTSPAGIASGTWSDAASGPECRHRPAAVSGDYGDPRATYVLLRSGAGGEVEVQIGRVPYEVGAAARAIVTAGLRSLPPWSGGDISGSYEPFKGRSMR